MGSAIGTAQRHAPRRGQLAPLAYGAALAIGGALSVAGLGRLVDQALAWLPRPLNWLAEAGLLKLTFTLRGLDAAAGQVEQALEAGDLPEARRLVRWHLVSRDTTDLSATQVAAATIESVAENTSDGILAPLFYYAVGGLPAALAYRFINTADSMLGYRDPAREWLGKVPARLDDLANLLPARLTAALLMLAAAITAEDWRKAWRVWRHDRCTTSSPNAGHPMSAMAGAVGVELEKVGHYRLGRNQRLPGPQDIGRAVRLMHVATIVGAGLLIALPLAARAFGNTRRSTR
jgi:adenosylcobinamide-phosphate synthase